MDEYEELEPFSMLTYSQEGRQQSCPTYSVSTFEQLCKLSVIMDRILCSLYSEKSSTRSREDLLQASAALKDDLKHWRAELPQHLSISSDGARKPTILPHTLSLM
jgi:hypothetical protein